MPTTDTTNLKIFIIFPSSLKKTTTVITSIITTNQTVYKGG